MRNTHVRNNTTRCPPLLLIYMKKVTHVSLASMWKNQPWSHRLANTGPVELPSQPASYTQKLILTNFPMKCRLDVARHIGHRSAYFIQSEPKKLFVISLHQPWWLVVFSITNNLSYLWHSNALLDSGYESSLVYSFSISFCYFTIKTVRQNALRSNFVAPRE